MEGNNNLKESETKARQTELFTSFKGSVADKAIDAMYRRDSSKTEETKEKPDSKRFMQTGNKITS